MAEKGRAGHTVLKELRENIRFLCSSFYFSLYVTV